MRIADPAQKGAFRAWFVPLAIGALVRLAVAPFAEDQWGDAPVRLELARRWAEAPGLWWSFEDVFQFGPLPTHVGGLLTILLGAELGPRLLSLACGVAGVGLAARLALHFGGPAAGLAAGLGLALSPVHIQASTTFASEAIFLAFALGCLLRALRRDPWGMAVLAFAATTTRYDAWIWLPILGAWWAWTEWPRSRARALGGAAALGLGPASILLANALSSGAPMQPLRYISAEHVMLAARAQEAYGTFWWRLWQLAWWPGALVVALAIGFGVVAIAGVVTVVRRTIATRSAAADRDLFAVVAMALAPVGVYLGQSLISGSFWPMARFALGPAALLSAAMPPLGQRALRGVVVIAVVFNLGLVAFDSGGLGWWDDANPLSPLSRYPDDLRAGIEAVREVPGAVIDEVATYEDITVAHGAGVDRWAAQHPSAGVAPGRIVTLRGGTLAAALGADGRAFGATYEKRGEVGRVAWWDRVARTRRMLRSPTPLPERPS